jgi:hypothetical protein
MIPATLDVLEALVGPDEELQGLKNAKRDAGSVYLILARCRILLSRETTVPA